MEQSSSMLLSSECVALGITNKRLPVRKRLLRVAIGTALSGLFFVSSSPGAHAASFFDFLFGKHKPAAHHMMKAHVAKVHHHSTKAVHRRMIVNACGGYWDRRHRYHHSNLGCDIGGGGAGGGFTMVSAGSGVAPGSGGTGGGGGGGGGKGKHGSYLALSGTIGFSGTITVPGGGSVTVADGVSVGGRVDSPVTTAPNQVSGFGLGNAFGSAGSLGAGSAFSNSFGNGSSFDQSANSGVGAGSSGGPGNAIGAGVGIGAGIGVSGAIQ